MITIIVFALILSLLIFVHELGHFVTAKKAGIVVEEFGIGYPPRALKVWQDEGKITLNDQDFIIGRKTKVPRHLSVGNQVEIETKTRPDNQLEITYIDIIKTPLEEADSDEPRLIVKRLEKPTEYTLNWIPFGGFVKMLGEEDPSAPGSFASKSKKARFVVLIAGAVMNLITAVIIFTLMFMTGQPEPIGPTIITNIVPNSPAEVAGIKPNDIVLKVDEVVVESSRDLVEYTNDHKGEEIALTLLREEGEFVVSLVPRLNPPPGEGAMGVGIYTQFTQLRVIEVIPDSPAAMAKLEPNDLILKVDNQVIETPTRLIEYIYTEADEHIKLDVARGETEFETTLTLDKTHPQPNTSTLPVDSQTILAMGNTLDTEFVGQRITKLPFSEALMMGFRATSNIIIQTFLVPVAVIREVIPLEQARPVGPVGIYQITNSAVDVSRETNVVYPILFLTAILSTALAVTNLLPLPALDGGRIFFILVEAVRGKRISPEKEGAIHFIGLALLFTLMMVISYYDVTNPIDVSGLFR